MATLQQLNQQRWNNCHIPADKGPAFQKVADRILNNKLVYEDIEKATGVPWWFVGVTHYRESNLDMNTQLAQGDPLNKVSTHVPKGRGPFTSFKDGAVDALVNCAPYAARNKDWSLGNALTMLEKYNGLGYANKGIPSPYIWAGTNQYVSGKYVSDGVFDAQAVDQQLGCAGILKYLGIGKASAPIGAAAVAVTAATTAAFVPEHIAPWIIGGGMALAVVAFIWFDLRGFKDSTPVQTPIPGDVSGDNNTHKFGNNTHKKASDV